jgi:hypothetical protein
VANQISELNKGEPAALQLTIVNLGSPALHWLFRAWQVQDVNALAAGTKPEMVITPPGNVSLAAAYRGEPLVLTQTINWSQATRTQWLNWIIYRQMPMADQQIDLWVRSDLMLDNPGADSTVP